MSKIVITGGAGLLGKALIDTTPKDVELFLTYRNNIPGSNHQKIKQDLSEPFDLSIIKPDIIIHCASEGSVDKVQKDISLGMNSILGPTVNILKETEKLKCKLLYISSNAVFDGRNPLYKEKDTLCPVNNYGIMKAACEVVLQGSNIDWIIIRPLLMYGWPNQNMRGNWASIWLEKLRNNKECQAVYDVISQPLYNYDCARIIWKAIALDKWREIYNVAGPERITLYEFGRIIADAANYSTNLIIPTPSQRFTQLAPRPQDTSFDLTKLHSTFDFKLTSPKNGIIEMLNQGK